MADTVAINWIYPPGMQDGAWDEKSGNRHVIVRFVGTSDSTGETDVIKVDLDDLKTVAGNVPTRTSVQWIEWQIFGITVQLEWDRAPHEEIILLNANAVESSGRVDFPHGYVDPGNDDRTGDILLTTTNADSGDNYNITMCLKLKD